MPKSLDKEEVATITVRVTPRASRSEIIGFVEGVVKVRLASPPVDGAANAELIKLFSKKLDVPKSSVAIVSGETSRTKHIRVIGTTDAKVRAAIES